MFGSGCRINIVKAPMVFMHVTTLYMMQAAGTACVGAAASTTQLPAVVALFVATTPRAAVSTTLACALRGHLSFFFLAFLPFFKSVVAQPLHFFNKGEVANHSSVSVRSPPCRAVSLRTISTGKKSGRARHT